MKEDTKKSYYGEATDRFVRECEGIELSRIALGKMPEGVDRNTALRQIEGRRTAKEKLPSWYACEGVAYPVRLSMEQCSSETAARYKAEIAKRLETRKSLVDLTAGLGVDCYFLSRNFERTVYVERNEELCNLAQHNFKALGAKNIEVRNSDTEKTLQGIDGKASLLFLDPARRDSNGRKTIEIEDCEPNILILKELLLEKGERVMIKFSPMLDVKGAVRKLGCVSEIHAVSVEGECKELLFVLDEKGGEKIRCYCVNLGRNEQRLEFDYEDDNEIGVEYSNPLKYLYEANASVMKMGAHGVVARKFRLKKIAPFSHLFTSNELVEGFVGRAFEVEGVFQMNKKEIKEMLAGIERANVAVRNFPLSAEELKKKLKLKDGGDIYLWGTTLEDGKKIVVKGKKV